MKKSLSLLYIFNNQTFRKIALFDKNKILLMLLLSLFSLVIYVSFPLITQFYIVEVYAEQNLSLLLQALLIFSLLFLFKLVIDIIIEKYRVKYFAKIEKNLREKIILKYHKNLKVLVEKKDDLFSKHIHLYLLLLKTIFYNLLDITKVVTVTIIIFFFNKQLFLYLLITLPFFFLFYLIQKRIQLISNENNTNVKKRDFGLYLKSLESQKDAKKKAMSFIEDDMKRKIKNQSKYTLLNVSMNSFVGFYRLFYLTYFGYYIIAFGLHIAGLIVGLLYLTIFIRPCINLLRSLPSYQTSTQSFYKIHGLYKK